MFGHPALWFLCSAANPYTPAKAAGKWVRHDDTFIYDIKGPLFDGDPQEYTEFHECRHCGTRFIRKPVFGPEPPEPKEPWQQ